MKDHVNPAICKTIHNNTKFCYILNPSLHNDTSTNKTFVLSYMLHILRSINLTQQWPLISHAAIYYYDWFLAVPSGYPMTARTFRDKGPYTVYIVLLTVKYFYIILPSMPRSPTWSLLLKFIDYSFHL
jgi:hypothetical protein